MSVWGSGRGGEVVKEVEERREEVRLSSSREAGLAPRMEGMHVQCSQGTSRYFAFTCRRLSCRGTLLWSMACGNWNWERDRILRTLRIPRIPRIPRIYTPRNPSKSIQIRGAALQMGPNNVRRTCSTAATTTTTTILA